MKKSEKDLLLKIARNEEPQKVFDQLKKGQPVKSPYSTIVKYQINNKEELGIKSMQLPEPWNGHLSKAKIMFISSNPSIDYEDFPTKKWDDKDIVDFFDNRFKIPLEDKDVSCFWKSIAKYVTWIFPEASTLSVLEILDNYVVSTELVHCKSRSEKGVTKCAKEECIFMDDIIKEFNGDMIILLGSTVKKYYDSELYSINKENVKIAYLPHPNARGYTDKERKRLLFKI